MFKFKSLPIFCLLVIFPFIKSFAWGPEGHTIVGKLALQFLKPETRNNVLKVLGNMPMDTAANWMDIKKSNSDYDFMKPWHYLDFDKDKTYKPGIEDNIVNRLTLVFNELKHKNVLCDQQIQTDLLVLLHLMGDLHMPLHTGYEDDLGGNKVIVQYDTLKSHNLHRFWDEDIIRLKKITFENCLELLKNAGISDTIKGIDFTKWMYESRSLLDHVYDFPEYTLSAKYLDRSEAIVKRQLLVAGMRLANILEKLFSNPAPIINYEELTKQYKNGIAITDANKYFGKQVTICEHVYGIKEYPATTQINLGGKFPNNPLTIIIFAKNYSKFSKSPVELFTDKNVCVKGKIEEYKGKFQIVLESEEDIIAH